MLTTTEAAALLTQRGLTDRAGGPVRPDTVKHWAQRKLLPGARIEQRGPGRGYWLIPMDALETFQQPDWKRKDTRMHQMYEVITSSGDLKDGAAWHAVAHWEFLMADARGEVHHIFTKRPTLCEQMLDSDPVVLSYNNLGAVETEYED